MASQLPEALACMCPTARRLSSSSSCVHCRTRLFHRSQFDAMQQSRISAACWGTVPSSLLPALHRGLMRQALSCHDELALLLGTLFGTSDGVWTR